MEAKLKHPLAFDMDGNPITLPPEAMAWRVRRGGGRRGRPRPVFDQETGRQLEVALDATIEDLVEAGCKPDRYRLEAVDTDGRLIPDIVAIIELPGARDDEDEPKAEKPVTSIGLDGNQQLIAQLVATICGVTTAMVQHGMRPVPGEPAQVIVEQPAKPEGGADANPAWLQFLDPAKLTPLVAMIAGTIGQAFKNAGMPMGVAP